MFKKLIQTYIYSAGSLLLTLAITFVFINLTTASLIQPHDPFFLISLRLLFWMFAGVGFIMAWICLFGRYVRLQLGLIAWLATNLVIYQAGLFWNGGGSLAGYFSNYPTAFGISAASAGIMADVALGYLFLGSYLLLVWSWKENLLDSPNPQPVVAKPARIERSQQAFVRTLKISCTACGGHIEFPTNFFGERIPCPHCQASIILQKPRNLKMSCPACDEHVAFPDYALGQKIPCPHCHMELTLKEPA